MKLVIDISDEVYDWHVNGFPDEEDVAHLLDIVKNGTPLEECEDCVSRQALVEKATNWKTRFTYSKRYVSLTDILTLPSVTPKQRVGQWIETKVKGGMTMPCCSLCGNETGTIYEYDYCPNCGAKMGGEQNEVSD